MTKLFIQNISDLSDSVKLSFYNFLQHGILDALKLIPTPLFGLLECPELVEEEYIEDFSKYWISEIYIQNKIFIEGPKYGINECFGSKKSYVIKIFISINYNIFLYFFVLKMYNFFQVLLDKWYNFKFTGFNNKLSFIQDIHLMDLPLMTSEGTFIITGCERVVVNKMIRRPGLYFEKSVNLKSYSACLLADNAQWSKFMLTIPSTMSMTGSVINLHEIVFKINSLPNYKIKEVTPTSNFTQEKLNDVTLFVNLISCNTERVCAYQTVTEADEYEDEDVVQLNLDESSLVQEDYLQSVRIPIIILLYYFNVTLPVISSLKDQELLQLAKLNFSQEDKMLFNDLFELGIFFIGVIGRSQLNSTLQLDLPDFISQITSFDILKILQILFDLVCFGVNDCIPEVDDLNNKLVQSVGEMLQSQMEQIFKNYISKIKYDQFLFEKRLKTVILSPFKPTVRVLSSEREYTLFGKFKTTETFVGKLKPDLGFIKPSTISKRIFNFFLIDSSSQYLDQINVLSELTHVRKITLFTLTDDLTRHQISKVIRDIRASQYGRICPIDTPEGANAGLIGALALYGTINKFGYIETPFYFIADGFLQVFQLPVFVQSEAQKEITFSFCDSGMFVNTLLTTNYVFYIDEVSFSLIQKEKINFITFSPLQLLSLGIALVPFVEHNDANRALMGSNMQRQALPLLFPKKPIIGTGLELNTTFNSGLVIKSYKYGKVANLASKFIQIQSLETAEVITYFFQLYRILNHGSYLCQQPLVWPGEIVFKGQIIIDGPNTLEGELALGQNLLVAYMPWEGYNYEDAIVINDRLIINNCLTSIKIESYDLPFFVSPTDHYPNNIELSAKRDNKEGFKASYERYVSFPDKKPVKESAEEREERNKQIKLKTPAERKKIKEQERKEKEFKEKELSNQKRLELENLEWTVTPELTKDGVARPGTFLNGGDILLRQGNFDVPTAFEYIFNHDKPLDRYSICLPRTSQGRIINMVGLGRWDDSVETDTDNLKQFIFYAIRVYIASIQKIQVGDKLSGRHGNKGIIARILSASDMPYLSNGVPLDLLLNPLGVPSRMNVGQMFETLLGLAGEKLGTRFLVSPFDEIYGNEASRILINQKLKEAAVKTNLSCIYDSVYVGKQLLCDGRTGEYFDNPITIGRSYILKLFHLVEKKLTARSTGKYTLMFEQPSEGSKVNGGQRFGEMEVWALEAYGCAYNLQELLTTKSDNIYTRDLLLLNLELPHRFSKVVPEIPETSLLLIRYLNALGLDISFSKIQDNVNLSQRMNTEILTLFLNFESRLHLRRMFELVLWEFSQVELF
jgi:DNA-directed RNA polymerase subunit beta